MSYHYPGLIARERLFYFRLKIPKELRTLARSKEIKLSLNTSVYQEAIEKWRVEFAHLQAFLTLFKDIIMKVNEQKQITLTATDVDKLLLHRLEQIQSFLENNTDEIQSRHKSEADVILFPNGKKEADIRRLMQDMILDYLKGLVDKNKANVTLRTIYHQLRDKEIELGIVEKDAKYDWLKAFSTHISQLDHYAKQSVKAIQKDKHYSPTNPKIITLLRTYDDMKTDERIHTIGIILQACFALMERECIEDVNKQDCRTLCARIYRVPKRWTEKISKRKTLLSILTDNPDEALSRKSVKKYLTTFKEFMRYAVKEDIIENSLNEFVDIPPMKDGLKRVGFETSELRKIFSLPTYPNPHLRKNQARFWIPIIALYPGCRLNEICQLDVNDIVQEKGVPCISINDNAPDKSVKNRSSVRIIPLHPKLIDMGFLHYVNYRRKQNKIKLFELERIKNGMYGRPVQSWFARHLDKLGITDKSKVFHSFRHTFETMAVEKKIPAEYQNAICGWTDQGVGQRIYAHKKDINTMKEEISKISYPINRELNELEKEFRNCYVMR